MNKKEFIEEFGAKSKISKKMAHEQVNNFLDLITDTLRHGESINILGFGKFEVRYRNARAIKSAITGTKVMIPASKLPVFKAGKSFKEAIW